MNPLMIIGWLLTLAIATGAGWELRGDHEAAKQLEAKEEADRQLKAKQDAVDQLSRDLEAARAVQAPKNRIITREVVRYAQITPADRRCTLDGRWRMLHDGAATGTPPDTAGLAAGGAEPVTDAAALETVAGNYESCRAYAAQVAGWQRWWRETGN